MEEDEEKKQFIYIFGASVEVLTVYPSCIQNEGLNLTCLKDVVLGLKC